MMECFAKLMECFAKLRDTRIFISNGSKTRNPVKKIYNAQVPLDASSVSILYIAANFRVFRAHFRVQCRLVLKLLVIKIFNSYDIDVSHRKLIVLNLLENTFNYMLQEYL